MEQVKIKIFQPLTEVMAYPFHTSYLFNLKDLIEQGFGTDTDIAGATFALPVGAGFLNQEEHSYLEKNGIFNKQSIFQAVGNLHLFKRIDREDAQIKAIGYTFDPDPYELWASIDADCCKDIPEEKPNKFSICPIHIKPFTFNYKKDYELAGLNP